MTNQCLYKLVDEASQLLQHNYNQQFTKDLLLHPKVYTEEHPFDFVHDLAEVGARINVAFHQSLLSPKEFRQYLKHYDNPSVIFRPNGNKLELILLSKGRQGWEASRIDLNQAFPVAMESLVPEELYTDTEGRIPVITLFRQDSLVSNDPEQDMVSGKLTPLRRLLRLLSLERREIFFLYIYAIIIGIIGLAIPLGIQATINFIAGGVVFSSIYLLITLVILAVLTTSGLQIMQFSIVEHIQRRIFTKAAFEFAFRVPRIKLEAIINQHAPELMNRFFDVLTVQKGIPKLLMDLSTSVLQIIFGLILLSFYHPLFVFLGIIMLFVLAVIFYLTGPKGLRSSIIESKYKYRVAFWFEELARTITSFKMAGTTSHPLNRTQYTVNNYLAYRKAHFRVLISQFAYVVLFKTLIIGGLLVLGTWLVVTRQITIGQFVASEVVIVLILNSVEKIITSMDVVYDLLTAVDKIGQVTDLELERPQGIHLPVELSENNGLAVHLKDLSFTYPGEKRPALDKLSLDISPGERVCITGYSGSGKTTLTNVMAGLLGDYSGVAAINNLSLRDIDHNQLRDLIAKNIGEDELFDGTILENITIGKAHVGLDVVMDAIDNVGLTETIQAMPDGLDTPLVSGGKNLNTATNRKLILARCLVKKPHMLILNDFFSGLNRREKLRLMQLISAPEHPWTLIAVSNDPLVMAVCERVIVLEKGSMKTSGTFEDLCATQAISDLIQPQ